MENFNALSSVEKKKMIKFIKNEIIESDCCSNPNKVRSLNPEHSLRVGLEDFGAEMLEDHLRNTIESSVAIGADDSIVDIIEVHHEKLSELI
ncbi:MAG: hypothetical protein H8E34_10915 [Bacteroidetes bacterium]|nr:hypothetical protein [Bacteroidota bacterium]